MLFTKKILKCDEAKKVNSLYICTVKKLNSNKKNSGKVTTTNDL